MPDKQPEPRYLVLGRVLRPHGIKGEVRMEVMTSYPEHVATLKHVYVGPEHRPYVLESARTHQGTLLLKLQGVDDRNAAEALHDQTVEVALEDAVPLEEGEYYYFQLLGMAVETDAGEALGEVTDVLEVPGGNDVYVVQGPRGELLIPAIASVVQSLDLTGRRMVIHIIPGLFDAEEVRDE